MISTEPQGGAERILSRPPLGLALNTQKSAAKAAKSRALSLHPLLCDFEHQQAHNPKITGTKRMAIPNTLYLIVSQRLVSVISIIALRPSFFASVANYKANRKAGDPARSVPV
jgi:hypothetical protein